MKEFPSIYNYESLCFAFLHLRLQFSSSMDDILYDPHLSMGSTSSTPVSVVVSFINRAMVTSGPLD